MLLLLLPIQGAGYWFLLALSGMRHRTSLLTGALLTSYSEFALIVAALGVADGWLEPEWLVKLAVAVAGSFVIAAILNPRNTSALSMPEHHANIDALMEIKRRKFTGTVATSRTAPSKSARTRANAIPTSRQIRRHTLMSLCHCGDTSDGVILAT